MLRDCIAYRVFIASPDDCDAESEAAYHSVFEWNARYTLTTRRAMIPTRWTHQMIPMAGGDPQDLINEELLAGSDLLVAILKGQLGTRGTEREVRYFMENGKARRVMLFVHKDETLRDAALRSFVNEMKDAAVYQAYIGETDLLDHLEAALVRRAQLSLAARHIGTLRAALIVRVREWGTLDRNTGSLERAFAVLALAGADLTRFSERESGLSVGSVDSQVETLSASLEALTRNQQLFFERAPWNEAGDVVSQLENLVWDLPEERDLL
jgi:hypothetical protein